jgi:hypothetical protein
MQELLLKLNDMGINIASGLHRFNNNANIYLNFIDKFINDQSFEKLEKAIMRKDYDEALIYASAVQGIASNLGIVDLELKCKNICYLIHDHKDVKEAYYEIDKYYHKIILQLLCCLRRRFQ